MKFHFLPLYSNFFQFQVLFCKKTEKSGPLVSPAQPEWGATDRELMWTQWTWWTQWAEWTFSPVPGCAELITGY